MTIKQKQCLLCYLGCYSGAIDGIWGEQSVAATREFQEKHGLTGNGVFDADMESKVLEAICNRSTNPWDEIEFFERAEFACKCGQFCDGYPAEMEMTLIQVADRVRKYFGSPVIVSSGLRCKKHNTNVGGVANSRHLCGKAMDFCVTGKTAASVLAFVQKQPEIRYAYAIDGSYVHMDVA